ncbi:MAG: DEAD/DEAH box helicase, partial [Alphaproteobacteria bacterium]
MRPPILNPLFAPVTALPGIGPRLSKLVEKLAGPRVADLLWHLPVGIIDRRYAPKLADAQPDRIATVTVTIAAHIPPANRRLPYKVRVTDGSDELTLVFFHGHEDYLRKALPIGEQRVISGKIEHFREALQMTHPDRIGTMAELSRLQIVEPVYALTAGLTAKPLLKAIRAAIERAPDLPEWIDPAFLKDRGWKSWQESLSAAHAPQSDSDLDPGTDIRSRLAYDELLANQLALAMIRARQRKLPGRSIAGDGHLSGRVLAALPFQLTASQTQSLEEIRRDMAAPTRMLRLLQGDVGSGKTVVAFLAMLTAVEAGHQAALMAPTEILARQHMKTIEPLATAAGVSVALLTGREKGKARSAVHERLKSGEVKLAVGTHALFQEDVEFADLALAVVDEQHRFGVHQRL